MKNTRDYLYVIFMGLILFLSGAIILGGISYFIDVYIGFDFVSVLLYFVVSMFLTRQILKGISIRNKFVSIMLPLYTAIMYFIKDFVAILVILITSGETFIDAISFIPYYYIVRFISVFSIDFSVDGVFTAIINLLITILDILIMIVGVYNSYKITKRE
ncbi:hypothetical protein IKQ02_04495 [bacterium]|nr:hypothetical protein [bacterium]